MAFIPASMTNAVTSDIQSSISPGWVVMFLDSHRTVLIFLSWLYLLGVFRAFWFSILKIFKSLQNYWHRVTDITSFEKHLESSLGHSLSFYPNLVKYRFKNMIMKEFLPGLLRWSSLQTMEDQSRSDFGLAGLENSYKPSIVDGMTQVR